MESFEERIARRRHELVIQQQSTPYKVAVLGPGESHRTFFKRREIHDALMAEKFDAFFPEAQVENDLPLSIPDQERDLLRDSEVKWIIVLETSEGPLNELATFSEIDEIVDKTFVLIPEEFYTPGQSYPTSVIQLYENLWRFSEEELQQCNLVSECMFRARRRRISLWNGLHSQQF